MIFISIDALSPINRNIVSTDNYDTLIDFLEDKYPNGFDLPTDIFKSFNKVEVEDYDIKLNADDIVTLVHRPAVAALIPGISVFWAWVVNTAVMLAVNFAISKLFAPEEQQDLGGQSSVYSLNDSQNQAKLGAVIPIGYGTFRMYPSYIEQPYYRYESNEEYLYLLLCVGHGTYDINKIQIDTIDVTHSANVQYRLINKSNFGNIAAATGYRAYYNMRNNLMGSPAQLEMKKGVYSDYYGITPGVNAMEFDYIYPNGYFNVGDDGAYYNVTISFKIIFYDANKSEIKSYTTSVSGQTREVYRRTLAYAVNSVYKYFRIIKTAGGWNTKASDTVIMNRVKEKYPNVDCSNYGDITLLWVRMKATNAISSIGQQRVNGYFTRTDVNNDMSTVLTDIYSNKTYGGGLDVRDTHFPATIETINGVFENKQTVFDAMKSTAKAQKYTVYPVGQDILLKKDEPTNVTVGLYNEINILKGSFSIVYNFKDEIESYDSVEVSYRNALNWELITYKYPSTGVSPQTYPLFGVTSTSMAIDMAKYLWKQQHFRNRIITFDTDIQGFTLEFLDKIKISHSALMWGETGLIEEIQNSIITTSEKILADSNITIRNKDGRISDTIAFSRLDDYHISVPNLPSWVVVGLGYTIGVAKEFLVTSVTPKDENSVTIECVEYNKDIYT